MTEQLDFSEKEVSSSGETVPTVKKRGRPKGSKNKKDKVGVAPKGEQGLCNPQVAGSSPVSGSNNDRLDRIEKSIGILADIVKGLVDQKKLDQEALQKNNKSVYEKLMTPKPNEKMVQINVPQEITINGVRFSGQMKVPESLANTLKGIKQDREDAKQKELQYIEHPVKELAVLKGA